MRTFLALLMVLALPAHVEARQQSKAAVIAPIERWDRAWQIKDPALGARDYSNDASWVNAFGMRRTGRAAIERTLRQVFALPFVAAGESHTTGHDVRFLKPDVAVVATTVERRGQLNPNGKALGVRKTSHLRVLERRRGQWLIVSHLISDARDTQGASH